MKRAGLAAIGAPDWVTCVGLNPEAITGHSINMECIGLHRLRFEGHPHRISIELRGEYDRSDINAIVRAYTQHRDFQPGIYSIWDCRKAWHKHQSATMMYRDDDAAGRYERPSDDRPPVAIVVRDQCQFGMVRMSLQISRPDYENYALFYDHGAALQWLAGHEPIAAELRRAPMSAALG